MNIEISELQKEAFIGLCEMRLCQIMKEHQKLNLEKSEVSEILKQLKSHTPKVNEDLKNAVIQNSQHAISKIILDGIDGNSVGKWKKEAETKPKKEIVKKSLHINKLQQEAKERHIGNPKKQFKNQKDFFNSLDDSGNFNKIKKEDRPPSVYSNNKSLYPELNEPGATSF